MGRKKGKNIEENPKAAELEDKNVIITEQEQNSDPIFRIIYKKIRNMNKKVQNIESLINMDQNTLKEEQIKKIGRKQETLQEIKKLEEFALFYKSIISEKQSSLVDNKDLLIKISTFIAVGQYITQTNSNPQQAKEVFQNFYKPIMNKNNKDCPITDRIAQIFNLLNSYLANENGYDECRNFIAFMPSFEDSQPKNQQNPAEKKKEVDSEPKKYKAKEPLDEEIERQQTAIKDIEIIIEDKPETKETQQVDKGEKNLASNQKAGAPAQVVKVNTTKENQKEEVSAKASREDKADKAEKKNQNQKDDTDWIEEANKVHKVDKIDKEEKAGMLDKVDKIDKRDKADKIEKVDKTEENEKVTRKKQYNQNYATQRHKVHNGNRRGNNKNYDNRREYNKNWGGDNDYHSRNQYQPRAQRPRHAENEIRKRKNEQKDKDSDTSLEPTPEKVNRPKYIQKQ